MIEWLGLLGRWVHMITGIAWIGASFYFVWLDNHLQPPKASADAARGVGGEVWSVHGGGFYHAQKYKIAPEQLPATLHWFKWEAYTTWLSGIFLLALIYWYGAEIYLIDPQVTDLGKAAAVGIGVGVLLAGWVVYDSLCRSSIGENERLLGTVMFALLTLSAWGLCQLFSGRGAYIHFGAMLGTIMVANVFFVIIPGQRDMVSAKKEGRKPQAIHGIRGKQRSVHNTYFTLPVLFVMISNHYASTYAHEYNWLILIAISLAGALIRVYFVQRHFGKASRLPLITGLLLLSVPIVLLAPWQSAGSGDYASSQAVPFSEVQAVVDLRCRSCHARQPNQPGFPAAPKGIVLETAEDIIRQADLIHQQTVVSKAMPIANLTNMSDQERALLDRWYRLGVRAD